MSKPTEAFEGWVRDYVRALAPGKRFPPLAALAKTWGFSDKTVRTAMKRVAADGLVCSVPGRGTFVAPLRTSDTVPKALPPSPLSSTDSLVQTLVGSIHRGELKRGEPLAQIKRLCLQFGVAQRTVTAAYRRLEEMGYAVRVGKRYWLGRFSVLTREETRREAFLFDKNGDFPALLSHPSTGPALPYMEQELARCGVRLRYERLNSFLEHRRQWNERQRWPTGIALTGLAKGEFTDVHDSVSRMFGPEPRPQCPVLVVGKWPGTFDSRMLYLSTGSLVTARVRAIAEIAVENRFQTIRIFADRNNGFPWPMVESFRVLPELRNRNRSIDIWFHYRIGEGVMDASQALNRILSATGYSRDYLESVLSKHEKITPEDLVKLIHPEVDFKEAYAQAGNSELWVFADDPSAASALQWCRDHRRTGIAEI